MKAKRLELEFSPRNLRSEGGILILPPADAIELVDRAADEGVPILGIDGFRIDVRGVQPSLEHSVDYSPQVRDGRGCWEDASGFIREHASEMSGFEIVLGNDPIEVV